jgi:hypothetical protein
MPWTTDAKVTGNVCATYTWHNGGDALNTCDNTINDGKYAYNNLTAFYETWYHRINAHWHTDTEVLVPVHERHAQYVLVQRAMRRRPRRPGRRQMARA